MAALSPAAPVYKPSKALPAEPGRPWPLGAQADDEGVNFAVHAAGAYAVELCLFDAEGRREQQRFALVARAGDIWHGRIGAQHGGRAGLVYGLRVHGPWRPDRGQRFNRNKLLLDPYAREIVGRFDWGAEHFGADGEHPQHMDMRDNAATALKARVVADRYDWGDDRHPYTAPADTVIYEMHVKGFTRQHPGVPEALRGSYAAIGLPVVIDHLKRLGVSAVCLLPVHQHIDEQRLVQMGLVNYWGYNTIGFFCPEPAYASRCDGAAARDEFRGMVRALHAAGIEVILDVVYNHTAEGDERGPTLCWRGLDNAAYYRLPPQDRFHYLNWTGCGNTLDIRHPRALQMVTDSLRYWVQEMHVDGFRFDLAPVLGRRSDGFDRDAAFFQAIAQDPVLAGVKMIAEPWDVGDGGYQFGNFPRGWMEWNDHFRDTMRAFWLGSDVTRGEFAQRLCASSDVYQPQSRAPSESINYVISHDGFSLRDLVSYDMRHNLANGEDNRDGHSHNLSWNCGFEGDTDDPDVVLLRGRLMRALLATNVLAQGTPMLAAGSEIGHTQHGNNNPYCQDNPISWIDWSQADEDLLAFTAHLLALRRRLMPLADRWYTGLPDAHGMADLAWQRRSGRPLEAEHWNLHTRRLLAAVIGAPGKAEQALMIVFNAEPEDVAFALPEGRWRALLDSAEATGAVDWSGSGSYPARSRSVVLLERLPPT